jgi:homoserine dehydrogenase
MKKVKIGLLGCGTVGTGVARLLLEKREALAAKTGVELDLHRVADLETDLDRGIDFAPGVFVADAGPVVEDPEIDIVIEMIGGEGIARKLIQRAIENGKPVVTANKALLAKHGNELFALAAEKRVDLLYEASVGGCMPIIKSLRESLVANEVHAFSGILNGTCNYILSKITDEGSDFATALAQAQANGCAEADPTLDVDGFDTAHKLAILTSLAYGMRINYNDIYIEGISAITPMDIDFARQFGYKIKLLAISKMRDNRVEARVHPTMIPEGNMLSNVNGTFNAITVSGDAVGDIMLYGHGAGMMPTASAVVGDVVDLVRNRFAGVDCRVPWQATLPENVATIPVMPVEEIVTHYYFRFAAADRPGVLSTIAGILGENGISIKSVQQKGRRTAGAVPIVMLTHHAEEAAVKRALTTIADLEIIDSPPVLIRIENENGTE